MWQPKNIINITVVILLGLSAWLVFLAVAGYGEFSLILPNNTDAQVLINGHTYSLVGSSIKLRPGNYTITITSSRYEPVQETASIQLLRKETLKPKLVSRNTDYILSSTIGASGFFGAPTLYAANWIGNDWLTGMVSPSDGNTAIALNYANGQWKVAYFQGGDGYPSSATALPANIASYIENLEASHAQH